MAESKFPVVAVYEDNGTLATLYESPEDLPNGVPFVIVKTNATQDDLQLVINAINAHKTLSE